MSARKPRYFRVVYLDRDAKTCNVSDIVTDDTVVTNETVRLQGNGRNVNISTTEPQKDMKRVPSAESLLKNMPTGYVYDPNLYW